MLWGRPAVTEYLFPSSVEEALELLRGHRGEARIIAGGTDLMVKFGEGKPGPRCLVDITRIPGLDQIEVMEDFVTVGAAVTFSALKVSPFLQHHVHALVEAAGSVGAMGIQTVATWAGNIVQAMPAADGAIVAIALEAEARVVDGEGARWRPVESLFRGPGQSVIDSTSQILTGLRFPIPRTRWGTAWGRVGRRESLVLPILNCAARLLFADSRIQVATIALGPVAPCPFRARQAEAFLLGQSPTADVLEQAGRIARDESDPRSSIMRASREYRLAIIPSLVYNALGTAAERARRENGWERTGK
jgi:carbon-monoxide dehydrogenase medium subunit